MPLSSSESETRSTNLPGHPSRNRVVLDVWCIAERYVLSLKEFSQRLLVSSLIGRTCEVLYFPYFKDDELGLVIPADPQTLYNPMSKTFSVR
jgi:hypothetical protein